MAVRKRDGVTVQAFNPEKIVRAIQGAARDAAVAIEPPALAAVLTRITHAASARAVSGVLDVEQMQDLVEEALMVQYPAVARAYILYRQQRAEARRARLHPDPNAVADYVHHGKYARYIPEMRRREVFAETVRRSEQMHLRRYSRIPGMEPLIREAFAAVYEKRILPSMRSMQFGGEAIEKNHCRMYNCAFSLCDRTRFFQEAFFLLLCGTGVGFSVQRQHVARLPILRQVDENNVRHHVIGDTIEGWADAVGALFDAYLDGHYLEFSYHRIRPRGALLRTSGGRAPGHLPLKRALEQTRAILNAAQNRQLRPIECFSIMCHLADAVLSGGIRRSAMICLFSLDDEEMLAAKTGRWHETHPEYANANISVVLKRDEAREAQFHNVFRMTRQWGEPGFYFTNHLDYGANPCVEIGMNPVLTIDDDALSLIAEWSRQPGRFSPDAKPGQRYTGWQFCNLTEQNAARFRSREDFLAAARHAAILGTLQAGYADFPYLGWVSEIIARRESLIGVGMTGIMDAPEIALDPASQTAAAAAVIDANRQVAGMIGIRPAARCTCVKPSGTTSLELGGVGSGIHPHHARRYFRRIIASELEAVFQYFKSVNPHMCVKRPAGDWVIEFPVEAPAGAMVSGDLSAIEFLNHVLSTQRNWVAPGTARPESSPGLAHNVSNTVVVQDDEWSAVADFIWRHRQDFTGIALLPATGDKSYAFAPRESVVSPADEAKWNYLVERYKPVDYARMIEDDAWLSHTIPFACAAGACETV